MNEPNVVTDKEAVRQGTKNKMNVRVLAISLALILAVAAALTAGFLATSPQNATEAPPQAQPAP
jgi:hypothetical protein